MLLDPDTLPAEPTKQEVYDFVCRHLAAQGYRSIEHGNCMYFGPGDTRCAVGCLMRPGVSRLSVEGTSVLALRTIDKLYTEDPYLFNMVTNGEYADMLRGLQWVHDQEDNWVCPYVMPSVLRNVAKDYGIDPSILDRLDFGLIMPNPVSH
jgi:hypothetical protein